MSHFDQLRDTVNRAVQVTTKHPLMDIYQTEEAVIVQTAPLDGLDTASIEVFMDEQALTIRGVTRPHTQNPPGKVIRRERDFGAFERVVTIPVPIKAEEASAKVKGGMLTITLPLREQDTADIISIQVAE